jgi:hypothetical protein
MTNEKAAEKLERYVLTSDLRRAALMGAAALRRKHGPLQEGKFGWINRWNRLREFFWDKPEYEEALDEMDRLEEK